jgi:hypothetical protein
VEREGTAAEPPTAMAHPARLSARDGARTVRDDDRHAAVASGPRTSRGRG